MQRGFRDKEPQTQALGALQCGVGGKGVPERTESAPSFSLTLIRKARDSLPLAYSLCAASERDLAEEPSAGQGS